MPQDRKRDRRAENRAKFDNRPRSTKAYSRAERRETQRAARNWQQEA